MPVPMTEEQSHTEDRQKHAGHFIVQRENFSPNSRQINFLRGRYFSIS